MMIPQDFHCRAGSKPTLPTPRRVAECGLQRSNPGVWIHAVGESWLPGKLAFPWVENNIPLFLFCCCLVFTFSSDDPMQKWIGTRLFGAEDGEQKRAPCSHSFALGNYLPVWSHLWKPFFKRPWARLKTHSCLIQLDISCTHTLKSSPYLPL